MPAREVTADAVPAWTCSNPEHEGFRVLRRGVVQRARLGAQQRLVCIAPDGSQHFFQRPVQDAGDAPAPAGAGQDLKKVHCPRPGHAGARLLARGQRTTAAGTWQRYRCLAADGAHHFQVLADADGPALHSIHPAPACPEHPGSSVLRHGSYGTGARRRQRYRCRPADGGRAHTFTPALTREVVAVGTEACATCDELLSPHRGTLTGARHTPWTLALYARVLSDLSLGASYSSTSLMMRAHRDRSRRHLHEAHGLNLESFVGADLRPVPASTDGESRARAQGSARTFGQSAWHLAADVVEQYSPLLWRRVEQVMRERDLAQRASNDEALAGDPSRMLEAPVTWLLDEQHVKVVTGRRAKDGRRRHRTWFVLVVVEVRWQPAADPMTLPRREHRLRLARAYPRATERAWRLVLEELGVRPDFVIADHGSAIAAALDSQYGPGQVGFIPSLFHMRRNISDKLLKLPGLSGKVHGRKTLVDSVATHLDVLTRDDLMRMGPAAWSKWWDGLLAEVAKAGAPIVGLLEQRRLYEPKVAAALLLLHTNPHLPASNAAVENRIRHQLEPFMDNRKQMYRNLARLNFLLDLAVARSQGAFTDLDAVAALIRDDNEAAGGWAPAPRALADTQPPPNPSGMRQPRYASLFNPLLVDALADARLGSGLSPTPALTRAATPTPAATSATMQGPA